MPGTLEEGQAVCLCSGWLSLLVILFPAKLESPYELVILDCLLRDTESLFILLFQKRVIAVWMCTTVLV